MSKRQNRSFFKRIAIDIVGFGLVIIAPFLGWLPGPGGIPILLAGLGILALNYDWAENLLRDFDKRRVEFTNKYLLGNKKVARSVDILSLCIVALAIYIFPMVDNLIIRLCTLGAGSFALFIIISNQRRLDRFIALVKKRYHKHK